MNFGSRVFSELAKKAGEFLAEPFNRFITLLAVILALYSFVFGPVAGPISPQQFGAGEAAIEVHFFYHPACPHCKEQVDYNQKIAEEYPKARWVYHDITHEKEARLMEQMLKERGAKPTGTPTTIINDTIIVGFDSKTTPEMIRKAIEEGLGGNRTESDGERKPAQPRTGVINLPFIGEFDLRQHSLLSLAIILGFIDGFNPCAMWILVYLISIALTLHDRKRFLLVVGTFLFAEGALYFLIMTAWLNAFMFVGYARIVMVIVGAIAIWWGVLSLREFVKNRGQIACQVGDIAQKSKIKKEAKGILHQPLTLATFAGIVLLAFTVNSIEFVCSSAIPVVFTQVLALQNLPWWQTYGYVLVYCFLYMIDDIAVFLLAFFAAGGALGDKIASWGHAIGALILIAIGLVLLFAPRLLIGG
ncbi:MAG: hypothetical protein N3G22_01530 [Candidatus Micrarchaeota archaeon]|nr:hypothetical protein [Candidatus Micrarchaeota archaeon]